MVGKDQPMQVQDAATIPRASWARVPWGASCTGALLGAAAPNSLFGTAVSLFGYEVRTTRLAGVLVLNIGVLVQNSQFSQFFLV